MKLYMYIVVSAYIHPMLDEAPGPQLIVTKIDPMHPVDSRKFDQVIDPSYV